jgi:hypothetical protein
MAIEVSKFDILYGKLLSLNFTVDRANALAATLYQISINLNLSTDEILKYISDENFQFDNDIYKQLNSRRTNSSQLGRLEQNPIPDFISQQVV